MAELDWALRRGRVTASVLPQLVPGVYPDMRVFREKDALDAFNKITGRYVGAQDARAALGHRVERFALEWAAEREGNVPWAHFGSLIHPRADHFLATPDAAIVSSIGAKVVAEVKAVGIYMADQWGQEHEGADGVPPYVLVQQEAQAEVVDADECWTVAYFGGTDLRVYKWERDVTFGRYLLEVATKFFIDHVQKDDPPPPGPWTSIAAIAALYPEARRPLEPAPPDVVDDAEELLAIRDQQKALDELEVAVRARLATAIADREGFTGEGWRVRFGERAAYTVPEHHVPAGRVLDLRRVKTAGERSAAATKKKKGARAA